MTVSCASVVAVVAFGVFIVSVSPQSLARCGWDEYYDEIMDNCGPCREICDSMRLTRTEQQCKSQCSDYLVSVSCRSDQYFDEVVKSCAPCAELCNQRDIKGTTKECFRKCRKYVESNPPGNSQSQVLDLGKKQDIAQTSSSSSSSWAPGIITSVAIGLFAIVAIILGVLLYRIKRQPRNYVRAPGNDVSHDQTGKSVLKNGGGIVIPMEVIQPSAPVQVSSEEVGSEDIPLQPQKASTDTLVDDTEPKSVRLGIPECDPVAPSSAACWHVFRQQSS